MGSKLNKRLNARLDEQTAKKIEFLQRTTLHNTTDVVRAALELYFQAILSEQKKSKLALINSSFIGCIEDDENLSENYKSILAASWKTKT